MGPCGQREPLEWDAGTGQTCTEVVSTKESCAWAVNRVVDKPTGLKQFGYSITHWYPGVQWILASAK